MCKAHERTHEEGVWEGITRIRRGGGGDKELHEMLAVMDYSGSVPSRGVT